MYAAIGRDFGSDGQPSPRTLSHSLDFGSFCFYQLLNSNGAAPRKANRRGKCFRKNHVCLEFVCGRRDAARGRIDSSRRLI